MKLKLYENIKENKLSTKDLLESDTLGNGKKGKSRITFSGQVKMYSRVLQTKHGQRVCEMWEREKEFDFTGQESAHIEQGLY